MNSNNTARIFGFYKFDAFDLNQCSRASLISRGVGSLAILIILAMSIHLFPSTSFSFPPGLTVPAALGKFFIFMAYMSITVFLIKAAAEYFWNGVANTLNKTNADDLLPGFDLKMGASRIIAKHDIQEKGYFSAKGYWELHFEAERCDRETVKDNKKNTEDDKLKKRYPAVFKDQNETE